MKRYKVDGTKYLVAPSDVLPIYDENDNYLGEASVTELILTPGYRLEEVDKVTNGDWENATGEVIWRKLDE